MADRRIGVGPGSPHRPLLECGALFSKPLEWVCRKAGRGGEVGVSKEILSQGRCVHGNKSKRLSLEGERQGSQGPCKQRSGTGPGGAGEQLQIRGGAG